MSAFQVGDNVRFRAVPDGVTMTVLDVARAIDNEGKNTYVNVAVLEVADVIGVKYGGEPHFTATFDALERET
ncbi:MAG: hypothetical protein V4510_13140, partial [bacterium]